MTGTGTWAFTRFRQTGERRSRQHDDVGLRLANQVIGERHQAIH
jgi:hypothetical protein